MSVLKKLAGQTVLYGVSSILGRMLNFLLTPIYSSVFAPHQFGVVTDLYAAIAFLNVLYTFGFETAYFRFSTKKPEEGKQVYQTAFTMVTLISLAISLVLYLFAAPISDFRGYPEKMHLIEWTACILALDGITAIPFARLRLQNKAFLFATAKLVNILLNIAFNVFFLLICPGIMSGDWLVFFKPQVSQFYNPAYAVEYVFIANLLANIAYIPFLLPSLAGITLRIKTALLKPMFIYAFPILVMGLAGTVNEMFSRVLLEEILPANYYPGKSNMAALGIFGACYKIAVFMTISIQAFRYAGEPFFFSTSRQQNAQVLYAKVMRYFLLCCVAIYVGVCLNLELVSRMFLRREEYMEGLVIVPFLLLGNLFLGVYYNLSVWYKLTDRTYWGTYISVGGAIVTIVANLLLIPHFGYTGSAIATLVCYFSMAVASYLLGQKYYPVPYAMGSAFVYIASSSLVIYLFNRFSFSTTQERILYGLAISIAYLLIALIWEFSIAKWKKQRIKRNKESGKTTDKHFNAI